jgi:hypothetical protein
MQSDFHEPLNLGQDRLVTIDQLVDMVSAWLARAFVNVTTRVSRRVCAGETPI